jgi:5-methyltetrahydrofolate--homocysteine methyltransferase
MESFYIFHGLSQIQKGHGSLIEKGGKVMRKELNFNDFIVFDGAMGTMLQSRGLKAGVLPESYNFTHPDIVESIHSEYAKAGADVITTNSFGANRFKLEGSGLVVKDVVAQAVKHARNAAGEKLVALDIGPTGKLMKPQGDLSFEDAYRAFSEQIVAGEEAGADLILIETMSDVYEAKAAVMAAKENSKLPIICTMTFEQDGRSLTGTDVLTMVNILQNLGVNALGANCSLGPKEMMQLVEKLVRYSKLPMDAAAQLLNILGRLMMCSAI